MKCFSWLFMYVCVHQGGLDSWCLEAQAAFLAPGVPALLLQPPAPRWIPLLALFCPGCWSGTSPWCPGWGLLPVPSPKQLQAPLPAGRAQSWLSRWDNCLLSGPVTAAAQRELYSLCLFYCCLDSFNIRAHFEVYFHSASCGDGRCDLRNEELPLAAHWLQPESIAVNPAQLERARAALRPARLYLPLCSGVLPV